MYYFQRLSFLLSRYDEKTKKRREGEKYKERKSLRKILIKVEGTYRIFSGPGYIFKAGLNHFFICFALWQRGGVELPSSWSWVHDRAKCPLS